MISGNSMAFSHLRFWNSTPFYLLLFLKQRISTITGCKMFLRVPDKYTRSTNYRTEFIRHWPPEPGNYYHCVYCGRRIHTDKMQVDHIISVDMAKKNWLARRLLPKEGVNSIKNLVPSCQRCNRRKSNYGGLWLIRGYYWRICLPIFIILRIVLIAGAIVFALMLLGVISNKPLVDFVNGIVLGFFGKWHCNLLVASYQVL